MEKLNVLSLITIIISVLLSSLCFYHIAITILNKKIMIKSISESLINSSDTSIVFLFCLTLFMLGMGFLFVPAVIIIFAYS